MTVFANFWDPNLPHFQRKRFSTLEGLGIELGSLESAIYTGRKNRRLNQLGHVCCVFKLLYLSNCICGAIYRVPFLFANCFYNTSASSANSFGCFEQLILQICYLMPSVVPSTYLVIFNYQTIFTAFMLYH